MEKLRVHPMVLTTFFPETAVLLDLRKNVYYALNDVAADFWKHFTELGSFEGALKEVVNVYQEDADVVKKDLEELVDSLLEIGILETKKPPKTASF